MPRVRVLVVLLVTTLEVFESSRPVLQRTVEALWGARGARGGPCGVGRASARQARLCRREPGLPAVLAAAGARAAAACADAFRFDRWNCSAALNGRGIFGDVYRETALVFALTAAAVAHGAARACAAGALRGCACAGRGWPAAGCGDDVPYGRRLARGFLGLRGAGADPAAAALRQDARVGLAAVARNLREVCKCHGFSGSCTTRTCWKRLPPFESLMGAMKRHYHHAVKKRVVNSTSKRAESSRVRQRLRAGRRELVYVRRSPRLCGGTRGRECRDAGNCGTLCCGRGAARRRRREPVRCRCRMLGCCAVRCDTCSQEVDYYVCK